MREGVYITDDASALCVGERAEGDPQKQPKATHPCSQPSLQKQNMAAAAAAAPPRPPASKLLTGGALHAKIREYEQFANDVLKVDLQRTAQLRAKHQQEIEELEQLRRNIQQLQDAEQHELKSRVELGDDVFCRATVPDTRRIFISVGLGFHAEFSLAEAGRAIDLKQAAARAQVARCIDKAARIKAHLKFVSGAIRELQESC